MLRKAFLMSVDPAAHEEYARRHAPIWEELAEVLRAHGVHNYSIHLDPETSQLFGYAELEDEARWQSIADEPVCRRWWEWMGEIMPSNEDGSPVSRDLREVFYLP